MENDVYLEIRQSVHDDAAADEVDILEESQTDVLVYDFEQNREVNYHLVQPSKDWLKSLIFIAPDVPSKMMDVVGGMDGICDRILQLDPMMLISLRKIILTTTSHADLQAIPSEMGCEDWELCEFSNYLGMFWYAESAIIINMTLIEQTVAELREELHMTDSEYREETAIGIVSTIFHELRHLGLEMVYLPEDEYAVSFAAEDSVEAWARVETEKQFQAIRDLANHFAA